MVIRNLNYDKFRRNFVKGVSFSLSIGLMPLLGSPSFKPEIFVPNEVVDITDDTYSTSKISNQTFYIPSMFMVIFDDGRMLAKGNIFTEEDLSHIVSATIVVDDQEENLYDFLNYMPNLENLTINDRTNQPRLSVVDGSKLKDGIQISVYTDSSISSFNEEKYEFLRDVPSISSLVIGDHNTSMNLDSFFIQSLRNVSELSLGLDYNSNFKYRDLTYLDSLYLDGKPYDTCIYFSNEIIDSLIKAGVKVDGLEMDTFIEASATIHDIADGLGLYSDSTDLEKLNAILTYVLSNFSYVENIEAYDLLGEKKYQSFYREGHLTGFFENYEQICGNYASMVSALGREVGLDTYNLISKTHAWNAVEIGDYYYYVDPTWLDTGVLFIPHEGPGDGNYNSLFDAVGVEELFLKGDLESIKDLEWYLEDPLDIVQDFTDVHHQLEVIPEGLSIVPIPEKVEYYTKEGYDYKNLVSNSKIHQEYMISHKGKHYQVPFGVVFGLLTGLGVGKLIKKKKEDENEQEIIEDISHKR